MAGEEVHFNWAIDITEQQVDSSVSDQSRFEDSRSLLIGEEELLGKLVPLVPGVSGKDVFGGEVPPPMPMNVEVMTDAKVVSQEVEEGICFYAKASGEVHATREIKQVSGKPHSRVSIYIRPVIDEMEVIEIPA